MELQTLFNMTIQHLVRQNEASMFRGLCSYRGDNATKCAVGYFIADSEYSVDLESKPAHSKHVLDAIECTVGSLDEDAKLLLGSLQAVHDVEYEIALSGVDAEKLHEAVHGIARRYGLIVPRVFETFMEGMAHGQ
ncbi:hypothetical protein ACRXCV_00165 (plasmid) [Halobacteriovorax sp. GFR7]|uniref:hypothetical protein n=1 Tax=unclassified Halobacteriovorax TaxID=2639665 RepID=UPI003D971FF5